MSGGSSDHGGNFTKTPLSSTIVVVTRKKINRRNAISAMEPAFTSLLIRSLALFLAIYDYLKTFLNSPRTTNKADAAAKIIVVFNPPEMYLLTDSETSNR